MLVPMLGDHDMSRGRALVLERLYWRGRPLPLGRARFRFLLTSRERGYHFPGREEPDCLGREELGPVDPRSGARGRAGDLGLRLEELARS